MRKEKKYVVGIAQWINNPEYGKNIASFKAE
jgi:hypothetical protein